MASAGSGIDLERLFKLRLVVARVGEKANAGWWNTENVLGSTGEFVFGRGFPRTHAFARARAAFAAATARCREWFDPPACMTLWHLLPEIEAEFDDHWSAWLDRRDEWAPVFDHVAGMADGDVLAGLQALDLVGEAELDQVGKLRIAGDGRSVALQGVHAPSDNVIALLAAAFSLGSPGKLIVPYARLEG